MYSGMHAQKQEESLTFSVYDHTLLLFFCFTPFTIYYWADLSVNMVEQEQIGFWVIFLSAAS